MKIGVMGGTFDPPHIAHLVLAQLALEQLNLARVLFIPAGDPWRKAGRAITPAGDRLEMTRLAIQGNEAFSVDDREIRRAGPTYTVDTLKELRAGLAPDDELYFLVGQDALADMPHWHNPAGIAELAVVAVAPREGYEPPSDAPIPSDRLVMLDMPYIGLSSTSLRQRAEAGLSLRYMVPDAVLEYVREKGLYRR